MGQGQGQGQEAVGSHGVHSQEEGTYMIESQPGGGCCSHLGWVFPSVMPLCRDPYTCSEVCFHGDSK